MKPTEIAGMIYCGQILNQNVNNGQPVPIYKIICLPNGISTLEGWNARAAQANHRAFVKANGRNPKNTEELEKWVYLISK